MDLKSFLRNYLQSVMLTVLCFLCTYLWLGFHYGWVDDIFHEGVFRALLFPPGGQRIMLEHIGLARIYTWLYAHFPGIPWYGIWMYGFLFIAVVNIGLFLNLTLHKLIRNFWLLSLIFCLFYFALLTEQVYLLTFTRVSILLTGSSLLLLWLFFNPAMRFRGYTFFIAILLVLTITGMCIRPKAGMLTLALFSFPYLASIVFSDSQHRIFRLKLTGIFFLFIATAVGLALALLTPQQKLLIREERAILNILDGFNLKDPGKISPEDSIRLLSMRMWFYNLDECYNPDFVSKVDQLYTRSISESLQFWKSNLKEEVLKARAGYGPNYHQSLNWFWKDGFLILLVSLLFAGTVLIRFRQLNPGDAWMVLSSNVLILGALIIITILFKMEDRVLNPLLVLLLLLNLYWLCMRTPEADAFRKAGICLLVLCLGVFALLRVREYHELSREVKEELMAKRALLDELNRMHGKIILLDLWTITLLHQDPLEVPSINRDNHYVLYGEYWTSFFEEQNTYLRSLAGSDKMQEFYKNLYQKQDEVVFVFSDHRVSLYQSFFRLIYHQNFKLKAEKKESALTQIHYSFIPAEQHFNYYTFDSSFQDAPFLP